MLNARRPCSCLRIPVIVVLVMLAACGAAVLDSRDVKFTLGETKFLMLESGAIIVGKRQVGSVNEEGKITNSRGQLLAWVHDNGVRVRGGGSIPIKQDTDGSLYLSASAQQQAGLRPMKRRVRADGTLAASASSRGIPIQGGKLDRNRRIILAILLISENSLWGDESEDQAPGAPGDGASDQPDDGAMDFDR